MMPLIISGTTIRYCTRKAYRGLRPIRPRKGLGRPAGVLSGLGNGSGILPFANQVNFFRAWQGPYPQKIRKSEN